MQEGLETLEALLERYSYIERLPEVQRVKFADALRQGDDPLHIIPYLSSVGIQVQMPEDLFRRNDHPDEDELVCFWIPQGVAATINSDDLWLVFEIEGGNSQPGSSQQ